MRAAVAMSVALALAAVTPAAAAGDGWMWPVTGRVLTPYANDNARPYAAGMHRGIDVAADVGRPVVAARAGTVTHAGTVGWSGLTVAVRTADGRYVTSYLHLSSIAVQKGKAVAAGTPIGATGTSGRPSVAEPHLHFGVRLAEMDDHYVDPLSLLPAPRRPPAPVPAVPAPVRVRAAAQPALVPVAAPSAVPLRPALPPEARPHHGGILVLAGLAAIALVLFGRTLARAHRGVNERAAAAACLLRDQVRVPGTVRRILRT